MRSAAYWSAWFALLWVLVLMPLGTVQAQGVGTVEGQLVNGTPDGPPPGGGVPVTLRVVQGDGEPQTLETATDEFGQFRFAGLATASDLEYWLETTYLDVTYAVDEPYRFEGDGTTLNAEITVYETTEDGGGVSLNSVHVIVESFSGVLRISEVHLFGNAGDRTYVGQSTETSEASQSASGTTVFVPLPDNAVGLAFEGETPAERFVEVEGGVVDTEPVPPGRETSMVFFSYHLMVAGDTIPLARRFAYPVEDLNMLVVQPGLLLRSDQLEPRGSELFQGRQYDIYAARVLNPDRPLSLEFVPVAVPATGEGIPSAVGPGAQDLTAGTTRGNQPLLRWLGLGLAAVALVGAVAYVQLVKRSPLASASEPQLTTNPRARRLLAELVELEDAFQEGRLDQATYDRQRLAKYEAIQSLQR